MVRSLDDEPFNLGLNRRPPLVDAVAQELRLVDVEVELERRRGPGARVHEVHAELLPEAHLS